MSVEIIIFDLGKVLFDYDLNILSKSFSNYAQKKYLLEDINKFISSNEKLFYSYEKGLISSEQFYKTLSDIVELNMDYKNFCIIWNDIFAPIKEVVDFLPKLVNKYKLAILSNTNELHYEYIEKMYPEILNKFSDYFLSYKMNLRKPEQEIYNQVINYYNVAPEKIFFTDDLQINVEEAKKTKINAFVFKGIEKLKNDLISVGVKID